MAEFDTPRALLKKKLKNKIKLEQSCTPLRKKKKDKAKLNTPEKTSVSPYLRHVHNKQSYTPVKKRTNNKAGSSTPIQIPASPFLEQIGYGTGVGIYKFERSSKADSQVLTPWAVKKLLNGRSETIIDERLHFEAEILRQLDHPNVIGFRAFIKGVDGKPCLAMEALDTSLGDKIEERREESFGKKPFSPESIMRVGFETIKGVEYLHHNVHILHGDIKSWNILVTHDLNTIKLGDFGNSLPLTKSLKLDTSKGDFSYVGTRPWNPPEIIFENGPVTGAADIWSYGLVLWEMLTLSSPHCKDLSDEFSSDESSNDESSSDKSEASMNKSETFRKREKYSEFGTRPAVSNIDLGKDYERVLEIFFACTTNCYLLRPRAKALVNYYKKYININKRLL